MTSSSFRLRRSVLLAPALAIAVLLGCSDLMGTEQAQTEDLLAGGDPGIHPILVVTTESATEATLDLHLERVQLASSVASYQGEFEYDASRLTLLDAAVPEGITGSWHEAEKGRVRFVGVSLTGIEDRPVLTLHFATQGSLDAGAFSLRMEEVSATENFQDLTGVVRQAERPLLTRSPLP